jgi:hypothetical protein
MPIRRWAVALPLVAGCSDLDAGRSGAAFTARDSAGVEIVESAGPLWTAEQGWRIDPQPVVDIGVALGDTAYQLDRVRGVLRLRDGRIVIGELGATIKYFDGAGKHLTTFARRGQGPGEGNVVTGLHHYRGDSILMRTGRGTRPGGEVQNANVLDLNGKHGRAVPIGWPRDSTSARRGPVSNYYVGLQGIMDDGSFIVRSTPLVDLREAPGPRTAMGRFFRISPDGARADSILTVGVVDVDEVAGVGGFVLPIFRMESPKAAVRDPFMYWGNGSRFEIGVYDLRRRTPEGVALVRTIRAPHATLPAGPTERERYIRRMLLNAATPAAAATQRTRLERLPVRSTLPAFSTLVVDSEGHLWVEHYRISQPIRDTLPDTSDVPKWTVFDSRGAMLGDLLTPRGLQIMSVGADWVMGVWTDENGVEHVRVHRLVRR